MTNLTVSTDHIDPLMYWSRAVWCRDQRVLVQIALVRE